MDFALLVSFPRHILLGVLNNWLVLKDIVKLDTACGTAGRYNTELCGAINGGLTIFRNVVISNVEVTEWLVKRKVSVKSVDLKKLSLATKQFSDVCCKHLAHLQLHCQSPTTATDFVHLVHLQSACGRLESLKCSGQLSKEALTMLFCNVPALKLVDVFGCHTFDQGLIQLLASKCPLLEDISFPYFSISSPHMVDLAKGCPNLKVVYCDKIVHTRPRNMLDHSAEFIALCPNIRKLFVPDISEAAVLKIAECCPLLTVLHCTCVREVSNDALEKLTRNCPLIRRLCLSMFESLEARVICPLAKLRDLTVINSRQMNDAGVKAIVASCPKLMSVELTDCPLLTEESAYAMLTGLPKLQMLSIHSVNDEWLSKRTASYRLAEKFLKLHYPHVKCKLEFDDRHSY
jgi:hypothetical protein